AGPACFAGRGKAGAGVMEVVIGEEGGEPLVQAGNDRLLSHVNSSLVLLSGDRVLGRELAAVVGPRVVPRPLHLASTDATDHATGEQVWITGALSPSGAALTTGEDGVDGLEGVDRDDGRMRVFLRPDPG